MNNGRLLWTLVVFPGLAQCLNGGWSGWLSWGPCTSTVLGDVRSRERQCDNPAPSALGMDCQGQQVERSRCSLVPTTDGAWSSWSAWGTCSATCNGGLQSRTRTCTNPSPSTFGRDCRGNDFMQQLCNTNNCPEKEVAFSVSNPYSELTSDSTPTFIDTILNVGGGYNAATGKFTCRASGIYSFSLTIRHDDSDTGNPSCWYRVNGVHQTYVSPWGDAYEQASGTMIVKLNVGDVVDLECDQWEHARYDLGTAFSGILITPS